jgi:threonine synthase
MTPLVPVEPQFPSVLLKTDYLMPTLSFKDRGAVALVAKAQELGVTRMVADSSGNAGTAIAAYAAHAGIQCEVYVPASASPKKLRQIADHGATVHAIPGSRENVAAAAIEAVERDGTFYASHVYNPFFLQGTKTYAFELWEQLGGVAPAVLVLPVGNGTLLLGAYHGFRELFELRLIEAVPRLIALQAEGCAPLARAFALGQETASPVAEAKTVAEGIAIAEPARSRQILAAVRHTGGAIAAVPEALIEPARRALAERGLYVEPTAAVPWAATARAMKASTDEGLTQDASPLLVDALRSGERIVVPLCGAGLKAG